MSLSCSFARVWDNKICIPHCLLVVCLLECIAVHHLNINHLSLIMFFVMFFAGYISQALKNYTDHACDGEYVSLRCPHRTTISIQSSFYGRIVPSHQMCPSRYPHSYATLIKEDVACSVGTSLQVLHVKLDLLIFGLHLSLARQHLSVLVLHRPLLSSATQCGSTDISHSFMHNSSL